MALGDDVRFHTTAPITVPASVMTALPLDGRDGGDDGPVSFREPGIVFQTLGWYEVLLRVDWDPGETTGTRFRPHQDPRSGAAALRGDQRRRPESAQRRTPTAPGQQPVRP